VNLDKLCKIPGDEIVKVIHLNMITMVYANDTALKAITGKS